MSKKQRQIPKGIDSLVLYNDPVKFADETTHLRKQTINWLDQKRDEKKIEEILHSMMPAHMWIDRGVIWKQTVSAKPATAEDVIDLEKKFDVLLLNRKAEKRADCPIRRNLYTQFFDEMIRQVTIVDSGDIGRLLWRIREEGRRTVENYETLYCAATVYGLRKIVQAEEELNVLNDYSAKLQMDVVEKKKLLAELTLKLRETERLLQQKLLAAEKRRLREITYLRKTNQQFRAHLDSITSRKK